MITSVSNPKVRDVCALQKKTKLRAQKGLFVAEGYRLVKDIPQRLINQVFVSASFIDSHAKDLIWDTYETVSDQVMEKMSDTVAPQGVLALVKMPSYSFQEVIGSAPMVLVLQDVRDPGNLGTIFRSAEAAGVSGIILSSNSVDPFSPKCVRSTMGSLYRVPFIIYENLTEAFALLKNKNIDVLGADKDGVCYTDYDFSKDCAIVIGNEANGIYPETKEHIDKTLTIPMEGSIESLNAAVASSVMVFEAARQRRL